MTFPLLEDEDGAPYPDSVQAAMRSIFAEWLLSDHAEAVAERALLGEGPASLSVPVLYALARAVEDE